MAQKKTDKYIYLPDGPIRIRRPKVKGTDLQKLRKAVLALREDGAS